MTMKTIKDNVLWVLKILLGCALFSAGFSLFLEPRGMNAGGISGLAMLITRIIGFGSVGMMQILLNLPLFLMGGKRIGIRFFVGSLIGMLASSVMIDVIALYAPKVTAEPLIAAIYGGILSGAGIGLVFVEGASTGGSDILIRLVQQKNRNFKLGTISFGFDFLVSVLTGIVFRDMTKTLYTLIAIFLTSRVMDMVVYSFDNSKVALIISPEYEKIAEMVCDKLGRGVTYLYGQGYYSRKDTKVLLVAVKRYQLAQLKEYVVQIDPDAFIILQDAHQVLGDGFIRYSEHSL
ncbi:MAG: YitT family protein [Faecousia sp.]